MSRRPVLLRLLPVVLSLVVLGAHGFRAGSAILVGVVVALLALLCVRRPWAARVVQVCLVLGAIEWLMTLAEQVFQRAYTGAPVGRLVAILGTVTLFTALSALAFWTDPVRAAYRYRSR